MKGVHPYFNFEGQTEEAFEFYKSVFGGEYKDMVRFKDMPMEGMQIPESDMNKIMHVSIPLGKDTILMGTDTLPALGQKLNVGNNAYIMLSMDSKEEAQAIFGKLSAGGNIEMPLGDVPWGSYYGSFTDKFGVQWMLEYEYPK